MDMGDIHSCVTLSLCFTGISAGCGFGTLGNFWSILGLGIAVCIVGFPQLQGEHFAQMSRRELGENLPSHLFSFNGPAADQRQPQASHKPLTEKLLH